MRIPSPDIRAAGFEARTADVEGTGILFRSTGRVVLAKDHGNAKLGDEFANVTGPRVERIYQRVLCECASADAGHGVGFVFDRRNHVRT
jgi:hypothetical protein